MFPEKVRNSLSKDEIQKILEDSGKDVADKFDYLSWKDKGLNPTWQECVEWLGFLVPAIVVGVIIYFFVTILDDDENMGTSEDDENSVKIKELPTAVSLFLWDLWFLQVFNSCLAVSVHTTNFSLLTLDLFLLQSSDTWVIRCSEPTKDSLSQPLGEVRSVLEVLQPPLSSVTSLPYFWICF